MFPNEKTTAAEYGGNGVEIITNAAAGEGSYYLLIALADTAITCTNAFGNNYVTTTVPAGLTVPCSNTGDVTVDAAGLLLGVLK